MKKILLILTAFVFALSANVFAQTDANVSVEANVLDNLTIDITSDINLGDISQGDESVLNPLGGSLVNSNVGSSPTLGVITLSDFADTNEIDVSWTNATLDNAAQDDALTFVPTVTWDQDAAGDNNALTSGGTITADGTENITLSVGGTLDAPGGTGTYNTDNGSPIVFTLENTSN